MKHIERVTRIITVIAGVALISYISATPGDQILCAALGGACIGTTIAFIVKEWLDD